jgi:antitoxin component YwqK of YwqJK toxin-antitoxin module
MFSQIFRATLVIFIVLFVLIIYNTSCKKYEYTEDDVYSKGDSVFTLGGKPLTGTVMDCYLVTGEKYTEENYVNGVKNGKSIVYYKSGGMQRSVSYKNGLRDGFHITYFENGIKARAKSFKQGIAHGVEIHYFSDGTVWQNYDFENGKLIRLYRRSK